MGQIHMSNPACNMMPQIAKIGVPNSGEEVQGTDGMIGVLQIGQNAEKAMDFKGLLMGTELMQEKELLEGMTKEQEQTMTLLVPGMQNAGTGILPNIQNAEGKSAEMFPVIPENIAENIVNIQSMKLEKISGMAEASNQTLNATANQVMTEGENLSTMEQMKEMQQNDRPLEMPETVSMNGQDGEEKDARITEKETAEIMNTPLQGVEMKTHTLSEENVRQTITHDVMTATVPQEIPTNLAEKIVKNADAGMREFEIQIEPKYLGKITVKLEYQDGNTSISIICSESKTLETVKQNMDDIRNIVQKNFQEETIVLVDENRTESYGQQESEDSGAGRESEWERHKEQRRRKIRNSTNRFLQELRLGLVN